MSYTLLGEQYAYSLRSVIGSYVNVGNLTNCLRYYNISELTYLYAFLSPSKKRYDYICIYNVCK